MHTHMWNMKGEFRSEVGAVTHHTLPPSVCTALYSSPVRCVKGERQGQAYLFPYNFNHVDEGSQELWVCTPHVMPG